MVDEHNVAEMDEMGYAVVLVINLECTTVVVL
jgi:hypothetical protein